MYLFCNLFRINTKKGNVRFKDERNEYIHIAPQPHYCHLFCYSMSTIALLVPMFRMNIYIYIYLFGPFGNMQTTGTKTSANNQTSIRKSSTQAQWKVAHSMKTAMNKKLRQGYAQQTETNLTTKQLLLWNDNLRVKYRPKKNINPTKWQNNGIARIDVFV